MATSKRCENCGGEDHFSQEVDAVGGLVINLLPGFGLLGRPKYRLVVCGTCGLTQWFVPEQFLSTVKENFRREA